MRNSRETQRAVEVVYNRPAATERYRSQLIDFIILILDGSRFAQYHPVTQHGNIMPTVLRPAHRLLLLLAVFIAGPVAAQEEPTAGSSTVVTWQCTGAPCPWGTELSNHALPWPAVANPRNVRLGYTTTASVYLPSEAANRTLIWIDSGSATLYAGRPDDGSHRVLTTVNSGQYYAVSGLNSGEGLSVQADNAFTYQIYIADEPAPEVPPQGTSHEVVTWNCTGAPCPWGPATTGNALVWPTSANAVSNRLGYTTSAPIYLTNSRANGTSIQVVSGSVALYAGEPNASSHRLVATVDAGNTYEVSGLAVGEVLSVQSASSFTVEVEVPPAGETPPDEDPPGGGGGPSASYVTWTCTSTPCPWGDSTAGYALVWPAGSPAATARLGYTTSQAIYLQTPVANGTSITITTGVASVYAGFLQTTSHRLLATIPAGSTYQVSGLAAGEVISVQADSSFAYEITLGDGSSTEPDPPEPDPNLMYSRQAHWLCDIEDCTGAPWLGQVINWPSWAAYTNNARAGNQSRSVRAADDDTQLHPYMGSWANGCEITAHQGTVLIVEWERGTDVWRETYIEPGEKHVIHLTSPEDGALIESNDYYGEFAISVANCTPQPLP